MLKRGRKSTGARDSDTFQESGERRVRWIYLSKRLPDFVFEDFAGSPVQCRLILMPRSNEFEVA